MSVNLHGAFESTVHEGADRLARTWPSLLATGAVGGIDVSLGVLALLLVLTESGNEIAGSLAFGIGFLALTLANSELFTENFLVPIAAIVAKRASIPALLRLWVGTLSTNLLSGWIFTWLIILALPQLRPAAIQVGSAYVQQGIGGTSFASALLGGAIITLMTWMQHSSSSELGKLVAAFAAGFLLAAGHLNHAIVASLAMFAALHAGAAFSYLDWFTLMLWAALGNIIGGIAFVTILRLVQVGGHRIKIERERAREEAEQQQDEAKVAELQ